MSTAKTDSTSGKAAAERLSGEEAHHKDRNTEGQPSGKAVSRPLPAGCSLRILTDFAEKQKTRPLYEEAFGDPEDFTDYYYADKCRDNTIVAVTDASGAVLSMAHLNPYTLSICGHETKSYYIVAVATDVHFRHRGLMTAVLQEIFRIAADEHLPLIWLLPVDPAIYTPSGFEVICDFQTPGSTLSVEGQADEVTRSLKEDFELSCKSPTDEVPRSVNADADVLSLINRTLKEDYDIFCVRDETYLRRERIEAALDAGEEDSGLPDDPKIMVKVTDEAALRSMLSERLREKNPYDALRSLRCLFTEEV